MMSRDEAIARGIAAQSMLYDTGRKDATQLGWLYDLAAMAPDGLAVECGVHRGGSLLCWAAAREGRGEIVAVDYKFREGFHRHVAEAGLPVRLIEANSWEAPTMIDRLVAFCFIDADHSSLGVPRDVAAWPPKIMPGGIIVYHDYAVWKPGVVVQECVDTWQAEAGWEPLGIVGSAIAFRRPPC